MAMLATVIGWYSADFQSKRCGGFGIGIGIVLILYWYWYCIDIDIVLVLVGVGMGKGTIQLCWGICSAEEDQGQN